MPLVPAMIRVSGAVRPAVATDRIRSNGGGGSASPAFASIAHPTTGIMLDDAGVVSLALNGSRYYTFDTEKADYSPGPVHHYFKADILEQRRTTNPQTFRLYNTYTDASNYERGFVRWDTNVFEVGTEVAGTGVARVLRVIGSTRVECNTNLWLYNDGKAIRFGTSLSNAGGISGGAVADTLIDGYLNALAAGIGFRTGNPRTMRVYIENDGTVDFATAYDGAGAAAGTLLNAPTEGNPAKWLKVKIAGAVHYIPAWV